MLLQMQRPGKTQSKLLVCEESKTMLIYETCTYIQLPTYVTRHLELNRPTLQSNLVCVRMYAEFFITEFVSLQINTWWWPSRLFKLVS